MTPMTLARLAQIENDALSGASASPETTLDLVSEIRRIAEIIRLDREAFCNAKTMEEANVPGRQ